MAYLPILGKVLDERESSEAEKLTGFGVYVKASIECTNDFDSTLENDERFLTCAYTCGWQRENRSTKVNCVKIAQNGDGDEALSAKLIKLDKKILKKKEKMCRNWTHKPQPTAPPQDIKDPMSTPFYWYRTEKILEYDQHYDYAATYETSKKELLRAYKNLTPAERHKYEQLAKQVSEFDPSSTVPNSENSSEPLSEDSSTAFDSSCTGGNDTDSLGLAEDPLPQVPYYGLPAGTEICFCQAPIKFAQKDLLISCFTCREIYHGNCVSVSLKLVEYLRQRSKNWICHICADSPQLPREAMVGLLRPDDTTQSVIV